MGRGNVMTTGMCEGLYFVDYDFLDVYRKPIDEDTYDYRYIRDVDEDGYEFDQTESELRRDEFEHKFVETMKSRFHSFEYINKWISETRRALLENKLFYVVVEDNQWSIAIELIQKEGEYGGEKMVGLQMGLYKRYLEGIQEILLELNGEVGIYCGAWTHGTIRK